jgi:ABC-type Mn2+/Zn2+ transport system permease subunit
VNPIDLLLEPLAYDFFVRALVASALVGVACAVVGSFVVLKGMSFIGDAVSHAAFPGIVIAYMLGLPIILGGAVAAIGTALGIGVLTRRSGLRADSIIGVLFAGMFALGAASGWHCLGGGHDHYTCGNGAVARQAIRPDDWSCRAHWCDRCSRRTLP